MLVPAPVQQEVATQAAPLVAYVPARAAPGWKYQVWASPHGEVLMVFAKGSRQILFVAARYGGDCAFGMKRSFVIGGGTVYYTRTAGERRAWRCVNGVRLMVATSVPSDVVPDVGLARMAASAYHVQRNP
jgi:hypothetical protein